MIYAYRVFLFLLYTVASYQGALAFISQRQLLSASRFASLRRYAVPDWLKQGNDGINEEQGVSEETITVRFINTPSGKDVVVPNVSQGSNLLFIGDSVGVKLPRACRTGLCGSCTCEVQDPQAIKTDTNPRAGFATIRACSTKCYVPDAMTEMVVDVGRMRRIKKSASTEAKVSVDTSRSETLSDEDDEDNEGEMIDPMARFGDNWENDFKPLWELSSVKDGKLQSMDPKTKVVSIYNKYVNFFMHLSGCRSYPLLLLSY